MENTSRLRDKKICGIVGSPKEKGNVDILVSKVLEGSRICGAETAKLMLNDLEIKPCQSCGFDPFPSYCNYDDDMKIVYEALESSDAIVLGSPVYFDTVSAQAKLMIDRANCLMPYVMKKNGQYSFERRMTKKKVGVFVGVAGMEQDFKTSLVTVKGFFRWSNIELVGTILFNHGDIELGSVNKNQNKLNEAIKMGQKICKII